MTQTQQDAFLAASGFHASNLSFDIRLFVGGITILCAVGILVGLMHLLNSHSAWEKSLFLINVFALSFVLMMIFTYCA